MDYGFYLLNADAVSQAVVVYQVSITCGIYQRIGQFKQITVINYF